MYKRSLQSAGSIVHAFGWILVTLWLGVVGIWNAAWLLIHIQQAFSRTLHCPRGHAVDAFGPLRCGRCDARFEAGIFDPCPACGAGARFIACPTCGLAVRNRLP